MTKIDVYDTVIEGAKESIDMILNMFPSILAMVFAVNIFLKSGILDFFKNSEIISIMLMRPISSNASLGILNVDMMSGKEHHYGNVVGNCEFLKNKTVVGFENHGILSFLKPGVAPFLTLQRGLGNNGKDKTEGARVNNIIGTFLTSPILAQNPHLCDFLISAALRIKYKCRIPLTPLTDDIEWYSHNYILESR